MLATNWKSEYAGIPKIEIPVRLKDLDEATIKYYLPFCISALEKNAKKIKKYKAYVDGSKQDIDKFDFLQKTSGKAKNRIKENHAHAITQFKVGFRCGNKRQLVSREGINSDEVTYIEKFLDDENAHSKIIEWAENEYSTGMGITFIMPKSDIFAESVVRGERKVDYKKPIDGYDVKVNSPFIYENINNEENAVVYSSCIGESGLKDLFCFNVAEVVNLKTKMTEKVVTVYTRDNIYEYKANVPNAELVKVASNFVYGELPMTELANNKTRISTIEFVMDLLNTVNLIVSLEVNSLQDKVNQLLVFANCDIDQTNVDDLYENGVVCLPPAANGVAPSITTIDNNFNYSDINVLVERVLTRLYDIAGVPLASAAVSSGNNEAAYLGGGWTNANIIMNRDIIYNEAAEREELRKIIKICKLNPDNPVQNIHANEIDIKYNINQSNNYVAKSQAMQNLNDIGFAIEDIVKAIPFFGDEEGVAKRCKENQDKKVQAEAETANSGNVDNNVDNSNEQLTGDNLRGQQKQQQADQTTAEQAKSV